jgi:hypothetical protein
MEAPVPSPGAGYPAYTLMEGGSEVAVDKHNVGDYIAAVTAATLHTGVAAQLQAFRHGHSMRLPLVSPPLTSVLLIL